MERPARPDLCLRSSAHLDRLVNLDLALRFTLSALKEHDLSWSRSPEVATALEKMANGWRDIQRAVNESPTDHDEIVRTLKDRFQLAQPARAAVLNLFHVMLCTELEVFVTHFVDVVLAVESHGYSSPLLLRNPCPPPNWLTSSTTPRSCIAYVRKSPER